jgi:hypothetical protein
MINALWRLLALPLTQKQAAIFWLPLPLEFFCLEITLKPELSRSASSTFHFFFSALSELTVTTSVLG